MVCLSWIQKLQCFFFFCSAGGDICSVCIFLKMVYFKQLCEEMFVPLGSLLIFPHPSLKVEYFRGLSVINQHKIVDNCEVKGK